MRSIPEDVALVFPPRLVYLLYMPLMAPSSLVEAYLFIFFYKMFPSEWVPGGKCFVSVSSVLSQTLSPFSPYRFVNAALLVLSKGLTCGCPRQEHIIEWRPGFRHQQILWVFKCAQIIFSAQSGHQWDHLSCFRRGFWILSQPKTLFIRDCCRLLAQIDI